MPSVYIKETEYFDVGLRKFKRACEKAGILPEIRKREFYEKPTEMRKRKMAAATALSVLKYWIFQGLKFTLGRRLWCAALSVLEY